MDAYKSLVSLTTFIFASIALALFSLPTFAQQACETIQCDCAALLMDDWKNVCKARELAMVRQCKNGEQSDNQYCTAHGPEANHLALALKLSEVEVLPINKLPNLYKQVAALYWSIHKDLQSIDQDIESSKIDVAKSKVAVVIRNVDTLFDIQQQITTSWVAYEQDAEATESWNDFASDTLDMAGEIGQSGKKIWIAGNNLADSKRTNLNALAQLLIEKSAEVFEQAGYAFGKANQHDNSARTWKKAAEYSAFLIEVMSVGNVDNQKIQTLKYRRAAEIYRASYHWVKDEREGEAKDSLKKAQELFDGTNNSVTG